MKKIILSGFCALFFSLTAFANEIDYKCATFYANRKGYEVSEIAHITQDTYYALSKFDKSDKVVRSSLTFNGSEYNMTVTVFPNAGSLESDKLIQYQTPFNPGQPLISMVVHIKDEMFLSQCFLNEAN